MAFKDDEVVKSVERVFQVLDWFEETRAPAGATTVSRALGYPMSSTVALLKSMSTCGYLQFDPLKHRYHPTLRVSRLCHWLDEAWVGQVRLRDLIGEVSSATGELVSVSCQNDLEMLFVQIEPGARPLETAPAPGDPAPLFNSSIGLARLSRRSDEEIKKLVARYNRRIHAPAGKIELRAIMQRLRNIRQCGYNTGYDLYMPGLGAIAWALPAQNSGHSLVMAIGGPSERLKRREWEIVHAVGATLSQRLGEAAPVH